MKAAVIQISSSTDKADNLKKAVNFIRQAINQQARLIVLPETFTFRGCIKNLRDVQAAAQSIPGESLASLMMLAKKYKVFIVAGSIYEKAPQAQKVFNTSVFIDNQGAITARYRKMNLFKAMIGKKHINEADVFMPGKRLVTACAETFCLGFSICYDLRFPQMYNSYARRGVNVFCVPSAFTHETGRAHWEILVRARAIENRCYVLAPNQVGKSGQGVRHYGHSMIVGPWGEVLARAGGDREEIIYAELKIKNIKAGKKKLPAI